MTQKTVLVIEDSQDLAESLFDMLEIHGYTPLLALTGKEGVSSALAHHPDLIMLDIRLPDIDGYEVFRQIRSDAWGASARILILTASESIEVISKNVDVPIEHVLFKPNSSMKYLAQRISDRLQEV